MERVIVIVVSFFWFAHALAIEIRPETVKFPCDLKVAQENSQFVIEPVNGHSKHVNATRDLILKAAVGELAAGIESYPHEGVEGLSLFFRIAQKRIGLREADRDKMRILGIEHDYAYSAANAIAGWIKVVESMAIDPDLRRQMLTDPQVAAKLKALGVSEAADLTVLKIKPLQDFMVYQTPARTWMQMRENNGPFTDRKAEAWAKKIDTLARKKIATGTEYEPTGLQLEAIWREPGLEDNATYLEVATAYVQYYAKQMREPKHRGDLSSPDLKGLDRLADDLRKSRWKKMPSNQRPEFEETIKQLSDWRSLIFAYYSAIHYCKVANEDPPLNYILSIGANHFDKTVEYLAAAAEPAKFKYRRLVRDDNDAPGERE